MEATILGYIGFRVEIKAFALLMDLGLVFALDSCHGSAAGTVSP